MEQINIELSDADVQLLREVLESTVSDLSPEIADTDNPTFRRELTARREQLRSILQRLPGSAR